MSNVSPLIRGQLGASAASQAPTAIPAPTNASNFQLLKDNIAAHIRDCFSASKQHRQNEGIDDRMISAMRAVRGEYDPDTLRDIEQFGGSKVYARITASKVRGMAALLREVYGSSERPWAISPTPVPDVNGPTVDETIAAVMKAEIEELLMAGGQPTPEMLLARQTQLREKIMQARKKAAQDALNTRTEVLDDILTEGGFYNALWDFLLDIATFPFGCVKGPVISYKRQVKWVNNMPTVENLPTMQWLRCSPFDVFFAPWSQSPQDGYIIHRQRTTRSQLQALIGLPSYDTAAIQRVLALPPNQMQEWYDYVESERADLEQRESDTSLMYSGTSSDRPFPMLEFHGSVSGKLLKDWGMAAAEVPDESQDLDITAYLVGGEVIGVRKNPHPTGSKPFYVDSFERVPGSVYGHAVPDLIDDVQSVANAAIRALVNNLAIASGPMAWLNEDRLSENDPSPGKMWPWKVWRTTDSLNSTSNEKPMEFFQPDSNAQTLMAVYEKFAQMADELSSLPRYMQGNTAGLGGAGRTASGLSMMIEASNRTVKQSIASIDQNVIEPALTDLNIYLALTRPDLVMEGDIAIVARGAVELAQRETLRMRRLEYLNITNNPTDLAIVGPGGRANVLKEISRDLGMPIADTMQYDTNRGPEQLQAMQGPPQPGQPGQPAAPGQAPAPPVEGVARPPSTSPGQ